MNSWKSEPPYENRLKENKELFNESEIEVIDNNKIFAEKLYMLGINDGKSTYEHIF